MKQSFFLPLVLLLLGSCAGRIQGSLDTNGSGDFIVNTVLQPRISTLIRSLSALGGDMRQDSPIIDGTAIAASMAAVPGIASVSFHNSAANAIEGPVKIARISDFLASGGSGLIAFEQGKTGGRCSININHDSGPKILSLLSPQIAAYLSALMAPIATGEAMPKPEYLALVATVYGAAIADEISKSTIQVSIEFPGPVRSVQGGTFSGKKAAFTIPLLDLLVLETPLVYHIEWQ
jgi:hypothetical protein